MKSKSQVSIEFTLMFAIVLLVSMLFLRTLYNNLSKLEDKKDLALMQALANNIKNEIVIASQVHDNYIRKFELPYTVNDKNYSIKLEQDELILEMAQEKDKKVHMFLPESVKGGFLENNELGFLDYCITKNNNELRISRNQVSLEYSAYDFGNDGFDVPKDYDFIDSLTGTLSVNKDNLFRVYLRVNCIFNLQSIDFKLLFDDNLLSYLNALKPIDHAAIMGNPNILSEWLGESFYYDDSCGSGCKHITIIKNGKGPLGSGVLAEFEFKASKKGNADITIDNLKLIDASITPTTIGYIPPSAVGTSVVIT